MKIWSADSSNKRPCLHLWKIITAGAEVRSGWCFLRNRKESSSSKLFMYKWSSPINSVPPCSCERASQYILRMKFLKAISQTWRGHHSEHSFSLGNSCPEFSVLLSPLCNTRHTGLPSWHWPALCGSGCFLMNVFLPLTQAWFTPVC